MEKITISCLDAFKKTNEEANRLALSDSSVWKNGWK